MYIVYFLIMFIYFKLSRIYIGFETTAFIAFTMILARLYVIENKLKDIKDGKVDE